MPKNVRVRNCGLSTTGRRRDPAEIAYTWIKPDETDVVELGLHSRLSERYGITPGYASLDQSAPVPGRSSPPLSPSAVDNTEAGPQCTAAVVAAVPRERCIVNKPLLRRRLVRRKIHPERRAELEEKMVSYVKWLAEQNRRREAEVELANVKEELAKIRAVLAHLLSGGCSHELVVKS
ncbi:hypothetical protein K474DRAFT_1714028 [Panus rudis PR-1116 ss-1]|nr:hypothetical protein K474DRAFT_1714028 [Panus rudis PR-1116 ss-1]